MANHIKYLALVILLLASCTTEPEDITHVIEEKAAERLAGFRNTFATSCRQKVEEAAIARADSLLLDRARKLRTLAGRPPKPRRPGAPPVAELSEALPLRPLFPFEIRFDTLLRDSLYQDSLRLDSLRLDSLLKLEFPIDSLEKQID